LTIHDNQEHSVSTSEYDQFHADVTQDQGLKSSVITLAYKNPVDSTRHLSISVAPDLGSNFFSYQVGEYDLIYCDRELLKQKAFTGNFVLWPFPNRVRNKHYSYQGREYSLTEVPRIPTDPMLVHGLVYDCAWQFEQPIVTPDKAQVTTYIDISEDFPYYTAYPFESRLSLTYTLTKQAVTITYTVENKGEQTLPFGFALHPYFTLLSGKTDTKVSMPAETVMEADEVLLPTGRMLDVKTIMYTMFDLRKPRPLGELKLDHVYTDLVPDTNSEILYEKQHFQLSISATPDFTHMVIYTSPTDDPFFCLENQTCATDAINLQARGLDDIGHLLEVQPGEKRSGSITYTVSFDSNI
jgi:aldose 1-epimerase